MRSYRRHARRFVGARGGCSPGPLEAYTLPMLQAYLARLKPHSSKERGARTRGPSGR